MKITQSTAILRYIGKKHNLFGKSLVEETKIDELIETAQDVMLDFASLAYNHKFVSTNLSTLGFLIEVLHVY